ncbi:MAG: GNAT family N-acetyltransferase [Deltaproteobacteria bacterium]|nr:GNAT family N-acetyltransferase [Deltaproteobacteria bacterium]
MEQIQVSKAELKDLAQILQVQKDAFFEEDKVTPFHISPMTETLEDLKKTYENTLILKAVDADGNILGTVRGRNANGTTYISRLAVSPEAQRKGIAKALLVAIEKAYPAKRFELFTRKGNIQAETLYLNHGFEVFKDELIEKDFTFVYMQKEADSTL